MKPLHLLVSAVLLFTGPVFSEDSSTKFFSSEGRETTVAFDHKIITSYATLEEIDQLTLQQRESFKKYTVEPTLKYLFGPLTHRTIGGPQRGMNISVDWTSGTLVNGKVVLKYSYTATWILAKTHIDLQSFDLPVPLNSQIVYTTNWKSCTDWAPDHQTESFFWYFWDPSRYGCDHIQGEQYDIVKVKVGDLTPNTTNTHPEYDKLLKSGGQDNNLQMTFGFGYVTDVANPNVDTDYDSGVREYRKFVSQIIMKYGNLLPERTKVLQGEYRNAFQPELVIGTRFKGVVDGVNVTINVVAAAGIDPMEIFAKSFAHDHDGFFGWFGHSRVGSGFDAQRFGQMLLYNPEYYSVTSQHQLVYWGGCNSYSYYTLPFFDFKAAASGGLDPKGTLGLDIIANGLPSYFSFNSANAEIALKHLMNWKNKPTYQTIVTELEAYADSYGTDVLISVLGDEDNQ